MELMEMVVTTGLLEL